MRMAGYPLQQKRDQAKRESVSQHQVAFEGTPAMVRRLALDNLARHNDVGEDSMLFRAGSRPVRSLLERISQLTPLTPPSGLEWLTGVFVTPVSAFRSWHCHRGRSRQANRAQTG